MSEPTIDEMLAWLDRVTLYEIHSEPPLKAIRAILQEHRPMERGKGLLLMHPRDIEIGKLEAVRAFVERVEKRLPDYNTGKGADSWLKAYRLAVHYELAAMEKEANEAIPGSSRTN